MSWLSSAFGGARRGSPIGGALMGNGVPYSPANSIARFYGKYPRFLGASGAGMLGGGVPAMPAPAALPVGNQLPMNAPATVMPQAMDGAPLQAGPQPAMPQSIYSAPYGAALGGAMGGMIGGMPAMRRPVAGLPSPNSVNPNAIAKMRLAAGSKRVFHGIGF